jgi:hypothetical protein
LVYGFARDHSEIDSGESELPVRKVSDDPLPK